MKSLEVDYFIEKDKLLFVWETAILRWYFLDELRQTLFSCFQISLQAKNKFQKCNSYIEFYNELNRFKLLEEFVSIFDYGLWDGDPDKRWD